VAEKKKRRTIVNDWLVKKLSAEQARWEKRFKGGGRGLNRNYIINTPHQSNTVPCKGVWQRSSDQARLSFALLIWGATSLKHDKERFGDKKMEGVSTEKIWG